MKMKLSLFTVIVVLMSVLLTGCGSQDAPAAAATDAQTINPQRVERGRYLVNSSGCHDCHTPWKMTERGPEPDMTRMLSGHPSSVVMPRPPKLPEGPWLWMAGETNTTFAGPWGVTFAFNLTPDTSSGLGIWTEDMFIRALRTGRHMGTSRQIMPPMPWQVYKNLNDEDLKSIYAYLRTIPPIRNHVPVYLEPHEVEAKLK